MLLLKSLLQLLQFFTFLIINRNNLIPKVALLWKENQKYKRYFDQRDIKIPLTLADKWFIRTMYVNKPKVRRYFTMVTPETILYSWKKAIKNYWTKTKGSSSKNGRPPINNVIKKLIKNIKISNYLWRGVNLFIRQLLLEINTLVLSYLDLFILIDNYIFKCYYSKMLKLLIFFFELLFKSINCNEKNLIVRNAILEKEISILKRRVDINNSKIIFKHTERLIFALTQNLSSINNLFSIVKTDTVLKWYKIYIKKKWTFSNKKKSGRPTVNKEVVKLVLAMKNSNIMWGCRRISHELQKVNISISHEAVRRIISINRKKGKIKNSLTWNKFIKSHLTSLYSMDFFTVDSILGKHYYILVILEIKTRKIVQFAITEYPIREFVRQQIIEFTNNIPGLKYLIHDRAPEFCSIDYS